MRQLWTIKKTYFCAVNKYLNWDSERKAFWYDHLPPFTYQNFQITTSLEDGSEMEATYSTLMPQHTYINGRTHLWVMQWGWQGQCPDDPLTPSGKLLSERQWETQRQKQGEREREQERLSERKVHSFYISIKLFENDFTLRSFCCCLLEFIKTYGINTFSHILSESDHNYWIKVLYIKHFSHGAQRGEEERRQSHWYNIL